MSVVDLKRFTYHAAVRNLVADVEQLKSSLLILRAASEEYPDGDPAYAADAAIALHQLAALLPSKEG